MICSAHINIPKYLLFIQWPPNFYSSANQFLTIIFNGTSPFRILKIKLERRVLQTWKHLEPLSNMKSVRNNSISDGREPLGMNCLQASSIVLYVVSISLLHHHHIRPKNGNTKQHWSFGTLRRIFCKMLKPTKYGSS